MIVMLISGSYKLNHSYVRRVLPVNNKCASHLQGGPSAIRIYLFSMIKACSQPWPKKKMCRCGTDQVALHLQGWEWWSWPDQAGPKILKSTIPPRYYGLCLVKKHCEYQPMDGGLVLGLHWLAHELPYMQASKFISKRNA